MKFIAFSIVILVLWIVFQYMRQSERTSIKDKISGKVIKVVDKYVDAYLGIPYAIPPVGNLRFRPPQPARDWNFNYEAARKSPSCMQNPNSGNPEWSKRQPKELSEDCLYINIWAPAFRSRNNPLATMVWIYGGGFNAGSSNMDIYDGAALASIGNVIVVSFNYRVGAFGFANFDRHDGAGNMGMLDQVIALKWVHKNIEAFGGQKDWITIFGESAGSVSVAHHLISPMTKGLFRRAILQSGSNYQPLLTVNPENNIELTSMLSSELGCNKSDALKCARNVNSNDVVTGEKYLMQTGEKFLSFLPQKGSPFLPEDPFRSIDAGKFHDVDIMIGETKDEGSLFLAMHKFKTLLEEEPILSKDEVKAVLSKAFKMRGEPLNSLVKEYLGNVTEEDSSSIVRETIRALGNGMFNCPIFHLAEKLSRNNRKVFHFVFNHTRIKSGMKKWLGVFHSADVPFVFGMPFVRIDDYVKEEARFGKRIIELWTSFAKTGKPSYEGMDEEWSEFDEEERKSFSLTLGNFHLRRAEEDKCEFWKNFYGYN